MKKIHITYHMSNQRETAENCVTIPVTDELAALLLAGEPPLKVEFWINDLAEMQGYIMGEFICAALAKEAGAV